VGLSTSGLLLLAQHYVRYVPLAVLRPKSSQRLDSAIGVSQRDPSPITGYEPSLELLLTLLSLSDSTSQTFPDGSFQDAERRSQG